MQNTRVPIDTIMLKQRGSVPSVRSSQQPPCKGTTKARMQLADGQLADGQLAGGQLAGGQPCITLMQGRGHTPEMSLASGSVANVPSPVSVEKAHARTVTSPGDWRQADEQAAAAQGAAGPAGAAAGTAGRRDHVTPVAS